jgi:tetrapyrrole methylase family protein/MazG family protein
MGITVVGLGPGSYRALTLEAVEALHAARELYLRTAQHPTVAALPASLRWQSFDHLYEEAPTFDALYERIAEILLARGAQSDITYAVPGHPLIGEASVQRLLLRAPAAGIAVRVVGGMSFLEAVLTATRTPGVEHLQVVDALALPVLTPTLPLVVYQVYKPAVASDLKVALLRYYPPEHPVLLVHAAATAGEQLETVELAALDRGRDYDHLTALYLPPLAPEASFGTLDGLAAIVARLRGPNGCPWDLQQTHESIKKYVLEEAYEVAEAIDAGDWAALCDELGDLLLQVVLHAQMADERGVFDLRDVIHTICRKLVRRHPHVFGSLEVADAAEVERNWEAIKRRERGEHQRPPSVLDGLGRHGPALAVAQGLVKRLLAAGLLDGERAAAQASLREATAALLGSGPTREAALARALFALAWLARLDGHDAEEALRQATRRVIQTVERWERESSAASERPALLAAVGAAAAEPAGE